LFYKIISILSRGIFRVIYPGSRIEGLENIPVQGSAVVCSNHKHWLDPVMIGVNLPRDVNYMAKEELFENPVSEWVVRHLRAFPVKRHTVDRKALKHALGLLADGELIGIFPEGTRSKTGELQEAYGGVAWLAIKSASPVIPVGVVGSYRLFKPMVIRIGEPRMLTKENESVKGKDMEILTKSIMQDIEELLR